MTWKPATISAVSITEATVTVSHGANAATPRPPAPMVIWTGTASPANAKVGDIHLISDAEGRITGVLVMADADTFMPLTYTDEQAAAAADATIAASTTDDLAEGENNLYYTQERAEAAADSRITAALEGPSGPISAALSGLQSQIDSIPTDNFYTATVTTANWTGANPHTATITVTGLLATDRPLVDVNLSGVAFAQVENVQREWGLVYRAEASAANQLRLYATKQPSVNFALIVQAVR